MRTAQTTTTQPASNNDVIPPVDVPALELVRGFSRTFAFAATRMTFFLGLSLGLDLLILWLLSLSGSLSASIDEKTAEISREKCADPPCPALLRSGGHSRKLVLDMERLRYDRSRIRCHSLGNRELDRYEDSRASAKCITLETTILHQSR